MTNTTQIFYIALFAIGQLLTPVKIAFAVTANPDPISYIQPDGSKLTILLKGDEFIHWAVTSDGFTIMTNSQGTYEYATTDKRGRLVFSGIQANDPGKRSQAEITILQKTAKGLFFSETQVREMKNHLITGEALDAMLMGGFPTTGTRKLLMILANFSNTTTTYGQANFNNYMNQVNYNGTGSFRDYYLEVSYGQLTVNTTVTVWVTVPNTHDYYGPQANWGQFAFDAIVAANNQAGVNFAEYDNNLDGTVDGVAIIHQGQGQEETGNITDIWSHSWNLTSAGYSPAQRTFDGVQVDAYTTMPEKNATGMGTIGVMCHEFCHNLGAPDFYDTDYNTNGAYSGTGKWDVMGAGSWNGVSGTKPAHPNAWIKAFLNWTTPVTLSTVQNITLRNAKAYPDVVRYNTQTTNEYFLCENRQQTGFDCGIPGHGLIIYHVDGNFISAQMNTNTINTSSHQGMYPVCANAGGNPTTAYGTINGTGCTFPGTGNKTSFTDASTPHAHSWANANTNFAISNIFEYTPTLEVTFCFIGCSTPDDPTTFTATPFSLSQINLSWGLNTNNNPVLIAYSSTPAFGTPVTGINYSTGDLISGGGTVICNGTSTNYSHIGLNASTTYYYKAWSVMPGVTYSTGVISRATTLCGTISSFPWNEGFENGGVIPGCWTQQQVNNSCLNWVFPAGNGGTNPAAAHGGTYNACLKDKTVADNRTRLITPALNLTATINPQLSFWHTQPIWSTDQDQLSIYYKTSAGGTWTLLATYGNNIVTWTQETISLPNATGTYYIAFEGNAKFGFGICLDDIQIANGCITYVPVSVSIAASLNPVCAGTLVTDTAIAYYGGTSPSFQWKVSGINVAGATNASYSHSPANSEEITCVLTSNVACATGNPAVSNLLTLIANPPLLVGSISGNQTICAGTTPDQLVGSPPLNGTMHTSQWQNSLDNVTFNDIPGATSLNYQPGVLTSTMYYRQLQNASGICGGPLPTNSVILSVNQWQPVSVSISPSANPVVNDSMVIITASPTNCGTTPLYQWKVNGANVTGVNTDIYSYAPVDADVVTCILVSNANCAANNPATSNAVIMSVISVPTINIMQNINVTGSDCFDAIQTITVAGDGTTFTVESGGSATMIAGQNIIYLPGTSVLAGGYMIGSITTTGQFCGSQSPSIANVAAGEETIPTNLLQPLFKVYPNPTDGVFVLELEGSDTFENSRVDIYNMTGAIVITKNLTEGSKQDLSLSNEPTGIYLLKLVSGKSSVTTRIIKQ